VYEITGLLSGNFHVELICPQCSTVIEDVSVMAETEYFTRPRCVDMKLVTDRAGIRSYTTNERCKCGEFKGFIIFENTEDQVITVKVCNYCDKRFEEEEQVA